MAFAALVMASSFAVLILFGSDIYGKAPPIPAKVVSETGEVLFTGQDIKDGQNVWQSNLTLAACTRRRSAGNRGITACCIYYRIKNRMVIER